jgi:hypothetical protein
MFGMGEENISEEDLKAGKLTGNAWTQENQHPPKSFSIEKK